MSNVIRWSSTGDWLIDNTGVLGLNSQDQEILQNIRVLLSTRPGDMRRRPGWGFDITSYLSRPNTQTTIDDLKTDLYEAISTIPNISEYFVYIDAFPRDMDQVAVTIEITSPANVTQSTSMNLTFGVAGTNNYGYAITSHTPYTSENTEPVLEVINVTEDTNEIPLAHRAINTNLKVYDAAAALDIVDNQVNPSGSVFPSVHIVNPSGVISYSGDIPVSGVLPCSRYSFFGDISGNTVVYGESLNVSLTSGMFFLCSITDSNPPLVSYTAKEDPVSILAVPLSGDTVQMPDATMHKGILSLPSPQYEFDLTLGFTSAVAQATAIVSHPVTLDKNSISYFGRSTATWSAKLNKTLTTGQYIVGYTRFAYA